jgi:hypothetical protein
MGSSKIGPGENAARITPAKTAAIVNLANHLQRALGSLPSGKSRSKNTTKPMAGTQTQDQIQTEASPPGSNPGRASSA